MARLRLDFEIDLPQGGTVRGRDYPFELVEADSAGSDDRGLAAHLVRALHLDPVAAVRILRRQVIDADALPLAPRVDAGVRVVDLSHTIEHGLVTYPGLPSPLICDYLSREDSRARFAPGVEFQIARIDMVANTGTYIDCPSHRYAHGADLSEIDAARFVELPACVIRVDGESGAAIDVDVFRGATLQGRAVLVHSGWDRHWNTPRYFEGAPHLTAAAAEFLRDAGAVLVGIDSVNIDALADLARPVHSTLLGADILIVEHLRGLEQLPDQGFTFTAVPPKVKGVGTFPVRALARVPDR